jgi:RHS repeat-associated protein
MVAGMIHVESDSEWALFMTTVQRLQRATDGNITSMIYPAGDQPGFTYDDQNRCTGLADFTTYAGIGWIYEYDAEGRMTSATCQANGTVMTFGYDGLNRLIYQSWPGMTPTIFCYAGKQRIEERAQANNASIYRYYYDSPTTDRITFRQTSNGGPGGGTRLYYQYDAQGNTTHVSNDAGQVVEQYLYDAYGTPYVYNAAGSYLGESSPQDNRYLFHGASAYEWLASPGLYYCRNRMYLPYHGRWLQPDPLGFKGGDVNLYRYCGNDPENDSDANGLYTTISFYATLPIVGHIGISTSPTQGGSNQSYGFFPDYNTIAQGKVQVDSDTPSQPIVLETTPAQEAAINNYIQQVIQNPGFYALTCGGADNCATFVHTALAKAGLEVKDSIVPKTLFKNIEKALKSIIVPPVTTPSHGNNGSLISSNDQFFSPGADIIGVGDDLLSLAPVPPGDVIVGQVQTPGTAGAVSSSGDSDEATGADSEDSTSDEELEE